MGFFSFIGWSPEKPAIAKKASLFKDFDAERERLRNFDLEAPIESEPKPNVRAQRSDPGQS